MHRKTSLLLVRWATLLILDQIDMSMFRSLIWRVFWAPHDDFKHLLQIDVCFFKVPPLSSSRLCLASAHSAHSRGLCLIGAAQTSHWQWGCTLCYILFQRIDQDISNSVAGIWRRGSLYNGEPVTAALILALISVTGGRKYWNNWNRWYAMYMFIRSTAYIKFKKGMGLK